MRHSASMEFVPSWLIGDYAAETILNALTFKVHDHRARAVLHGARAHLMRHHVTRTDTWVCAAPSTVSSVTELLHDRDASERIAFSLAAARAVRA